MLILLKQDINRLGKAGEIIKVKDGYGRNYLIPQGVAYPATDAYMKVYNESTKSKKYQEIQIKKSAEFLKSLLDKKIVTIAMKVGEDGKLFGSVTSQHIAEELKKVGIEIDKKKIHLEENIKQLGEYKIPYKSQSELETMITLHVVNEVGDRKPIIDEEELAKVPNEEVVDENEELEELEEDNKEEV